MKSIFKRIAHFFRYCIEVYKGYAAKKKFENWVDHVMDLDPSEALIEINQTRWRLCQLDDIDETPGSLHSLILFILNDMEQTMRDKRDMSNDEFIKKYANHVIVCQISKEQ